MKKAKNIPRGAKLGRPANLYFELFKAAKEELEASGSSEYVLVREFKDANGAHQAKRAIDSGKRKIPLGVRGWEIVPRRVPIASVGVHGVRSEMWAKLKEKK